MCKLDMQDTLKHLIHENFISYVKFLKSFIPKEVIVKNENDVVNIFEDGIVDSKAPENFKQRLYPFFHVDLKINDKKVIIYTHKPEEFLRIALIVFKKTLEELGKIPDIESKVLDNKFKKRIDTFLGSPFLPKTRPTDPNPKEVPRKYVDENMWVWELYQDLEENMKSAVEPLNEYITKFEKFKSVIELVPEEYVAKFDIEGQEKPVEFLLQEVTKFKAEDEKLDKNLKTSVHVSCFKVDSKDICKKMSTIYKEIQQRLVDLIAKRARVTTGAIYEKFKDIQQDLRKAPPDIES